MANELFSRRIKELRTQHKLTMDALAKKIDVKKSRISMWENNGVVPREDILVRLSQLYDISIDYLLGNDTVTSRRKEETRIIEYIKLNLKRLDDKNLLKAESGLKKVLENLLEEEEDL